MIYILATADSCSDYALANMLSLFQTIFSIICTIVPIILIVSLAISIFSLVTNPDQKGGFGKVVTKIAAAIIVFFLPTVVNLIMSWLPDGGLNITSCWAAAKQKSEEISMVVPQEF